MSRLPSDADTINRNLAANIRQLRRARGWSVAKMAAECAATGARQLTEASLGNIERGQDPAAIRKPREVTAAELFAFADLFHVSIDQLVGRTPCKTCGDQPPAGFTCNTCDVRSEITA